MNDYFDEAQNVSTTSDINPATINGQDTTSPAPEEKPRKKRHRGRNFLIWLIVIIVLAATVTIYVRYFNPYVTDARVTGYVTNVEKRGLVLKTYEGEMITESALTDTSRVYSHQFSFSVTDPEVVKQLQAVQGTGRPVTLCYEKFYGTLPWRGSQNVIVTGVISPDPATGATSQQADQPQQTDSITGY